MSAPDSYTPTLRDRLRLFVAMQCAAFCALVKPSDVLAMVADHAEATDRRARGRALNRRDRLTKRGTP